MFSFSSKKILSKLLSLLNNSLSALKISGRNIYNHSAFTLTELIVVITILSILSVIGFTVMSHQSSVARDGKRISDIQTLSQSAKITSAQLRLLPTPIADSVSLTVSGTFIGYQGFMSLALVNPLGYGSDKIFDPKDNIPYTYRVNQHYDSAQFMAYLENPRFERSIEIAKNQFLRNEEVGMNGFGGGFDGREQLNGGGFNSGLGMDERSIEIASQSLPSVLSSTLSSALPSILPSLFSQAYALDSSTTDLSSRYPYSAGDKLGIFLSKGSNQPLQNGVTGTGSRDISLSDTSTLRIIVGSSGADGYVSTDISTGSLLSLKDGSFDEKALLGMNGGSGGSGGGSGSGSGGGGGLPVSHILTMGEYSVMGETYYGYIGSLTISLYATFGVTITTVTPGSLVSDDLEGKTIDTILAINPSFSSWLTVLTNVTTRPDTISYTSPQGTTNCTQPSGSGMVSYDCSGILILNTVGVGSQHEITVTFPPPPPETNSCGLTSQEITQLNSIQGGAQNSGQSWCDRTYLDFSNKGLTELPSALSKLNQLQNLYFQNNSITALPTWVGTSFPSLQFFNGSNNLITSIPETFHPATIFANYPSGLTQTIQLQNNQITSLPNSWNNATFSNTQRIDLTGNSALGNLSVSLGDWTSGGCGSSDNTFTIREQYSITTDGGGIRAIQSLCLPNKNGKIVTWSPNSPAPGAAYDTVGYDAFETENHCGLTSAQVALMNESDAGYQQKILLGEYSDGFSAQNFVLYNKQLHTYDIPSSVGIYSAGWWCANGY